MAQTSLPDQSSFFKTEKFYNIESQLQRKNRNYQTNLCSTGDKPYRIPEQFVFLANYNLKPHLSKVQIKGQNKMKILKIPDEKKHWYQEKKENQKTDKQSLDDTDKWENDILNYFVKPKQGLINFD